MDEICKVKFSPLVCNGCAVAKLSCNLNVLLETIFKLLVVEKFPPRSMAYAFNLFVPATSVNVVVQFV